MPWSTDEFKKLKELIKQGLSGSQIGSMIGKTRSAVIAKCHREGIEMAGSRKFKRRRLQPRLLEHKPSRKRLHLKTKPKVKLRKRLKLKAKVVPVMSASDKSLGMEEFYKKIGIPPIPDNGCCKFIFGSDIANGNHTWCSKPTHNGSQYCKEHYDIVYATSQYRRDNYKSRPHYRPQSR